jgi:PAS domain S-box-containing protein
VSIPSADFHGEKGNAMQEGFPLSQSQRESTATASARVDGTDARQRKVLETEVENRFGVLPNFFRLTPETPEITANLWGFARFAYLDNPLPSLFKERLFVYLSQFCEVRYCIARHVGFLAGLGNPSGDAKSPAQLVEEIVRMLREPLLHGEELIPLLRLYASPSESLGEIPGTDSEMERALFIFSSHVFLQTADAPACLDRLTNLLGEVRLQYLILLLSFVRTAHYWTRVHPGLEFEADIKWLLETHEALAACVLRDAPIAATEMSQRVLDELPSLRSQAARANNLLTAIVDSSDDAIITKNLDGIITSWNRGAERLFGYSVVEAVGQSVMLIIPSDRRDEEARIMEQIERGERIDHFETVRVRKDGTEFDISVTVSPLRDDMGRLVGASKVARDISDRKGLEGEMLTLTENLEKEIGLRTKELEDQSADNRRQADQLRQLSKNLVEVQDKEQRRLSRELHDSVGQHLAGIVMLLDGARHDRSISKRALSRISEARDVALICNSEIRTISYLLHPPLLEEVGLASTLEWYVEGFTERSGVRTDVSIPADLPRLPADVETGLFRVVQQALANIHRHSGSLVAHIRAEFHGRELTLEVRDEGRGIPKHILRGFQDRTVFSGVGLPGMRERIANLGGILDITSDETGTTVRVKLSISNADQPLASS